MPTPVNKIYGHQVKLLVGKTVDVGGTPTLVYEPYALINADRAFSINGQQVEDPQVDLDDQSLPAVITRRPQSSDTGFSGGGMLHADTALDAAQWALDGEIRDCKILVGDAITVVGKYILASFEISGTREEAVTAQMSLVQAEKPTLS